jgi:hypothetical protein
MIGIFKVQYFPVPPEEKATHDVGGQPSGYNLEKFL